MSYAKADSLWAASVAERFVSAPLAKDITADLCVIGGGFTGLSAALAAADAGASVAVLEAEAVGHGGSGRNAGLVNAGLWLPPEDIAAAMGAEAGGRLVSILADAPAKVFELIERHQIDCEAVRQGTLHCAHNAAGLRELENRHRQLAALGAPVTLLDAAETAKRTGTALYAGALHDARAGTINPLGYCRGLARAATAAGAGIYEQSPVRTLARDGGRWAVETAGGRVVAEKLLLATNAYHLSVRGAATPETTPLYFFHVATEPLKDTERAAILAGGEGCWDTAPVMTAFRLDRAGRLIIGAIGNLEGFGGGIHTDWAARKLRKLFPALGPQTIRHAWTGRIAMTGDHVPKIMDLGPGAYASFGYSGRGIGPGTVFGSLCAQALLRDDTDILPLAPVPGHAERFAAARETLYEAGATLVHAVAAR
jgi:glycine/D-amino acid oxidase-like deaminating enzyme